MTSTIKSFHCRKLKEQTILCEFIIYYNFWDKMFLRVPYFVVVHSYKFCWKWVLLSLRFDLLNFLNIKIKVLLYKTQLYNPHSTIHGNIHNAQYVQESLVTIHVHCRQWVKKWVTLARLSMYLLALFELSFFVPSFLLFETVSPHLKHLKDNNFTVW